jgi:trehalose/maltose hydrolase-like predicted phosphorylase
LDEIASAQLQMVTSLEASLVVSLESFADTEIKQVSVLKDNAESVTDGAEALYSRYLNGKYAVNNNGAPVDSWNKLSEQVTSQISPYLSKWKGTPSSNSSSGADRLSLKNWRKDDSFSKNRKTSLHSSLFQVSTAANLQLTLEQIRLAQTSAEHKRFQLLKKLVSIKVRKKKKKANRRQVACFSNRKIGVCEGCAGRGL